MYITRIDSKKPSKEAINKAVDALKDGGLVVFPTETAYGLACDAFNASAVRKIFKTKNRDPKKTLPVIVATKAMAGKSGFLNRMTKHLTKDYWPGALTVVIPAIPGYPKGITNADGELALRVSSNPVATALSKGLGHPIVSTSANLSGKGMHYDINSAIGDLGDKVEVILDAGKLSKSASSTIVRCGTEGCEILREGEVSAEKIAKTLRSFC